MHLLTQSALLKALGWELFNSLWQMALLWLFYRILLVVFRKASAHARHGLAVLFLGTGVMEIGLGALAGVGSWPDGAFWAGDQTIFPFLQVVGQLINQALPYCSFLYLLVLATLFIRYSNQYFQSRQLRRQGLSKIQPGLRVFVAEKSRLMGIHKEVRIWFSSLIEGPVTLGFLKPVILIPLATASNLSTEQVEAILLHELAHIKRNDYLLHLGVTILEVLFFFNPFVRWLIRDIKKEREHRCDDLVLQFRYDPHTYVSALLSLATNAANRQGPQQLELALAATGGSDRLLLQRVRRILRLKEAKDRPGARALIFFLLTLAGALLISRSSYPDRGALRGNTVEAARNRRTPSESSAKITWSGNSGETRDFPKGPILGASGRAPVLPAAEIPMAGTAFVSLTPPVVGPEVPKAAPALHKKYPPALAAAADPDEGPAPEDVAMVVADDHIEQDNVTPGGEFATVVQQDDRDYSMGPAVHITLTAPAKKAVAQGQPFVPNSSFSFRRIEDTTRLKEQYTYLQNLACQEVEVTVKKIQIELQGQLHLLQAMQSKEQSVALKAQKQILEEQLKLQGQFLRQQQELERKLKKTEAGAGAGKIRRRIVVI